MFFRRLLSVLGTWRGRRTKNTWPSTGRLANIFTSSRVGAIIPNLKSKCWRLGVENNWSQLGWLYRREKDGEANYQLVYSSLFPCCFTWKNDFHNQPSNLTQKAVGLVFERLEDFAIFDKVVVIPRVPKRSVSWTI